MIKFIFEIKIKEGYIAQDYIKAWKSGSAIIQSSYPGACGTKLYQKTGQTQTLLAIASWESKEAREGAMEHMKQLHIALRETLDKHELYGEITHLGYFEEIESVDPP